MLVTCMKSFTSNSFILFLAVIYITGDAFCNSYSEQLQRTNSLYGMLVGENTLAANKKILRPFSSDGCSLSPNSFLKVNFVECCVEHDISYWLGGTAEQKNSADEKFRSCMKNKIKSEYAEKAYEAVSTTYYWGVRLGGNAYAPNSFRWGYGWSYMRGYSPLTSEEVQQAEGLYGHNLEKLRKQIRNKSFKYSLQMYTFDNTVYTFLPSDKAVYSYLRKTLKRTDMVTYGSQEILELETQRYSIKLASCGEKLIEFKLSIESIKQILLQEQNQQVPNIDYENAIISITDKEGCLK